MDQTHMRRSSPRDLIITDSLPQESLVWILSVHYFFNDHKNKSLKKGGCAKTYGELP